MVVKPSSHLIKNDALRTTLLQQAEEQRKGLPVVLLVYCFWAVLPIYWKQIGHIPAFEILCHRSLWGFLLVCLLLFGRGAIAEVKRVFADRRTLTFMVGCSAVHLFGWFFFIWAISNNRILELSLGSYVLPLLSMLAGFIFFKERPRRLQWAAIVIAACGVLGMIFYYGTLPWVALVSAFNSVLFAIFRKQAPVDAVPGLVVEMLLSGPWLWVYLIWLHATGQGYMGSTTFVNDLWLIGAGIVTVLPQLGYAYGLNRVPLITLSLLQYIPPTGFFLVGIFLNNEVITEAHLLAFICIWMGLILFTAEGYRYQRQFRRKKSVA